MRLVARHRPAILTASALAVLAAATAVPATASAAPGLEAPTDHIALAAPAIDQVRTLTRGAAGSIQQREAEEEAQAKAEARATAEAKAKAKADAKVNADAKAAEAKAAEARQRRQAARAAADEQAARSAQRVAADPRSLAASMAAERYGWGPDQFSCLDSLWVRESGWDHTAQNPSSGAYGIPQSLPGDKMASHGGDWRTNPRTQISWGLDYISQVYGTPCGAWGHSQSVGWY